MAMTAVRAMTTGGPASLSRFRGALVAAVLGDCVGGEFEGAEEVPMERVLQHLNSLDDESKGNGESEGNTSFCSSRALKVLQKSQQCPTGTSTVVRCCLLCTFHSAA